MSASGLDDFDEQFLAKIIGTIRESEPLARPSTAPRPSENKATAARNLAQHGATGCNPAQHPPKLQLAKQSHGGGVEGTGVAARPGVMSPRKIRAVRLLMAGYGVRQAAAAVGVSRFTIWRWVKDAAFQAEARRQIAAVVPLAKK